MDAISRSGQSETGNGESTIAFDGLRSLATLSSPSSRKRPCDRPGFTRAASSENACKRFIFDVEFFCSSSLCCRIRLPQLMAQGGISDPRCRWLYRLKNQRGGRAVPEHAWRPEDEHVQTVQTFSNGRTWLGANGFVPAGDASSWAQRLIRFCTHAHSCRCGA